MPHNTRARTEHRKILFLKALTSAGTISGAAKSARISREQVHRWLRIDESFARMTAESRRKFNDRFFREFDSTLAFLTSIIRVLIPPDLWPSIMSALAIAVTHLKNDLRGDHRTVTHPGKASQASLSLNGFVDVAIPNRAGDARADDLDA